MLDQGHYTWRHDSILSKIAQLIQTDLSNNNKVYVDLNGSWTIPPNILPTSDRPDLVVVNEKEKFFSIFEMTVPFETNIQHAHEYKCHKYAHFIMDRQYHGYSVKYFAFEAGCQGFITTNNANRLHAFLNSIPDLKISNKDFRTLKLSICKIAITTSFVIYKSKYSKMWQSTPMLCDM